MLIETLLDQYQNWQLPEPLLAPPEIVNDLNWGTTHRAVKVRGISLSGEHYYVIRHASRDSAVLAMPLEHERQVMQQAFAHGLAPRIVYWQSNARAMVTEFINGSLGAPKPELLGRTLRRIHELPAKADRLDLRQQLVLYTRLAQQRGVTDDQLIDPEFKPLCRAIEQLESAQPVLCHNDLGRGNLLITTDRAIAIDWEYAALGNRYFDIAAALAGWPELDPGAVLQAAIPRGLSNIEWQAAQAVYASMEWNWYQASGVPMPDTLTRERLLERLTTLV